MMTLTDEQVATAVAANASLAIELGWQPFVGLIARAIEPAVSPVTIGDRAFVMALASWQEQHALAADGILGPETWAGLQGSLSSPSVVALLGPPTPVGFDGVFATLGDPRPLTDEGGTSIRPANERTWTQQILTTATLAFPISFPVHGGSPRMLASVQCHRLLVHLFEAVFLELRRLGLRDKIHTCAGIYNFRASKGLTSTLSMHAFGAAIDLNAETNVFGSDGDMSMAVVNTFRTFGFKWGGDFPATKDPMHFQYATGLVQDATGPGSATAG